MSSDLLGRFTPSPPYFVNVLKCVEIKSPCLNNTDKFFFAKRGKNHDASGTR